jgi:TolB-like protein/cytochrome c-type biogenesis protein CcmH/NrfG
VRNPLRFQSTQAERKQAVKLLAELRRRHVFKVSIAYIVVAWVILQVTDLFADNIDLPAWAFRLVLLLLIVGFPLIVMFAWAYDLTPEGIRRTPDADGAASGEPAPGGPGDKSGVAQPHRASVAVLPFVNMSGDPENDYFSDGLAEELLNVLTKINALKVAARTSSFFFKGHTGDIADIARRLGVGSVLEGSVRRSGSRVRITAQLINAADGFHLWSETYDRELDDILAVQDDIAASVADALKVRLLAGEESRLKAGGAGNTRAFQAYLLGSHYRMRGSSDEAALRKALDAFNEAIESDPGYAQAYAGLAATWDQLATNSFVKFNEGTERATAAALKAIELAPDLADGHMVLGRLLLHYRLDQLGARKAINTAMRLNPGNAEVQVEYARISCYFDDVDASVAAASKALELDPLSLFAHYFLGQVLYFGRRYDEAIAVLRDALDLDPQFPRPRYTLGMCLFMKGEIQAALKEVEDEPLTWMRNSGSAIVLHRLGRTAEAEASLHRLVRDDDEEYAIYQQGQIQAQWGNGAAAIDALNRARDLHDPGVSQILADPLLDPIRELPGFKKLVNEMGFAAAAGRSSSPA